jgi:hypothetical protein
MEKKLRLDKETSKKILTALDTGEHDKLLTLLIDTWLQSVREGVEGEPNPIYDAVKKIMSLNKVEGCYFCDDSIDPNEWEFNLDTKMCMFCQLKVANILAALGIDHTKLFPLAGPRTVQKTQIRRRIDDFS